MTAPPDRDAAHTPWSDPGAQREFLRTLPADPATLPDALERFVVHHAIARRLGFGVPAQAESDRDLRYVERLIGALIGRDARPLTEKRRIEHYLYGTCHDFALLAVARCASEACRRGRASASPAISTLAAGRIIGSASTGSAIAGR